MYISRFWDRNRATIYNEKFWIERILRSFKLAFMSDFRGKFPKQL